MSQALLCFVEITLVSAPALRLRVTPTWNLDSCCQHLSPPSWWWARLRTELPTITRPRLVRNSSIAKAVISSRVRRKS